MLRFLILISTVTIIFNSCSSVYADRVFISPEQQKREISLANENILLLVAMDYESRGWTSNSSTLLLQLYQTTQNPNYATEYLISLNKSHKYQKVIDEFQRMKLEGDPNIRELSKAFYLIGKIDKAQKEILKIKFLTEEDYKNLALTYLQQKDLESGIKYLIKSYEISHSPEYLEMLTQIYLNLNRVDEVLTLLENHRKNYPFNQSISQILGKIYQYKNRYQDSLEIYKELYKKIGSKDFAIEIITSLTNLNKIDEVILFLETSRIDNKLLLQLYMSKNLFKKGFDFSKKLYEDSGEDYLLAQNAIFEYELNIAKNRTSIESLKSVISKLEKVVLNLNDPMYFNYLGYLMIDNSYRIQDGVNYVKKALEIEPDAFYIMDSLAWGQHKLGDCKDAFKTMSKVVEELGTKDSEISKHWIEINSCKEKRK